jgi:putative membrane protein
MRANNKMDFKQLLKTWLLLALGVIIAAHTAAGIQYESSAALIVAVLLLSVCNMVLKPVLMLFSLPFIILTFGIGI